MVHTFGPRHNGELFGKGWALGWHIRVCVVSTRHHNAERLPVMVLKRPDAKHWYMLTSGAQRDRTGPVILPIKLDLARSAGKVHHHVSGLQGQHLHPNQLHAG